MRLSGKIVVVTAAAQGIGRASAIAMAAEGATVWATDVNESALESLSGTANIKIARLDVLDQAAIEVFFSKLATVDVLFNCAGFVHNGTILEATDKDWDLAFNLNVRSMFWTIKAVIPKMLENQGGSIVNTASVAGSIKGLPNRFVYGASKAAVIGLTKAVAADYVTKRIRCNAIAPGTVGHAVAERQNQRVRGPSGGKKDVPRASAHWPPRRPGRHCAAGRVPCERRIGFRDWTDICSRRRDDDLGAPAAEPAV
jgi:2-keto-3-deoxy-L-fuconate dehydrogenase